MAAASTIAIIGATVAAGATAYSVDQARQQRKEAKQEMGRQQEKARRAEAQEQERQVTADEQMRQRRQRAAARAAQRGSFGRQGTVLGGTTDVGNAGTQAQSGAGKTLLGV